MRPGRQEGNTQLVCGGKTTHYQQQVELVLTWIEQNQKADDYVKRILYPFSTNIERAWPVFDVPVLCCI